MAVLPRIASLLDFLGESTSGGLLLSLRLLGVLVLRFARRIGCEAVNKRNDNLLDVDFRVQLCGCGEERAESVEVEFVGEHLKPTVVQQ